MNISISSQHVAFNRGFQLQIESRLSKIAGRYFDNEKININVKFSKDSKMIITSISLNCGNIGTITASEFCQDIRSSFELTLNKFEKNILRHKSKLKSKIHKNSIKTYTIDERDDICYLDFSDQEFKESQTDAPLIIAEEDHRIIDASVAEAVAKMENQKLPVLIFKNIKTGRVNAVYHRNDGNIAWLDAIA